MKRNKRGCRRCGLGAGKDRALGSHQLHLQRHLALLAACPCPCPELENVTGIEICLGGYIGGFKQGNIFSSRRTKYALNTYASKLSTITPPVTCFLSKFQYVMYSALSRAIFAYCLYQFVTCFCGISFYKCLSVNYIIFDKNEKLDQVYFNSSV